MTPELPSTIERVAQANPVRVIEDGRGQTADAQAALARILAAEPPPRHRHAPRRGRRVLIVAIAALLLAVGAALAATDPFGIFRNPDPGSAVFGVDSSRHVTPPTAFRIQCPQTSGDAFRCGTERSGVRYQLLDHVESNGAGSFNRPAIEAANRQARARGQITATMARGFDRDLAAVSDTFLARLRTLFRYGTLTTNLTPLGTKPRVPPPGVPALIVCEPAGAVLSCQDLNGDANAAVGSGIYQAMPAPDWRPAPPHQADNPWPLEVAILGHPPTAAELRLMIDLLRAGTTSTSSPSGQAQPQRAPPPSP